MKTFEVLNKPCLFLVILGYSSDVFAEPSVDLSVNYSASFIVYSVISIAAIAIMIQQHRKGKRPLWKTVLIWTCVGVLAAFLATPLLVFFFIAYHGRTM